MNLTLMAEAHRQLGDRERAISMHEEALAIARELGMSYIGGAILAFRALAQYDVPDVRRASLREGEHVTSQASVGSNTLLFYGFSIESCLLAGEWKEARRLSANLAASYAVEQPPIVEFLTERCRLLADAAEKGLDRSLRRALKRCRDHGSRLGYALFLNLLDQALERTPSANALRSDRNQRRRSLNAHPGKMR